jgi:hypothetical protein
MPEPLTMSAAAAWLGLAALGGWIGNRTDTHLCRHYQLLTRRLSLHTPGKDEALPPNHDLARAMGSAARDAVSFYLGHLVRQAGDYETFWQRVVTNWKAGKRERLFDENRPGFRPIRAIERALSDRVSLDAFADVVVGKLPRIAALMETGPDADVAAPINAAFADWVGDMVDPADRDAVRTGLLHGWPRDPSDAASTITIHQAFCFFFHEQLKNDPKVEAIFVAKGIKDVQARLDQSSPTTLDAAALGTACSAVLGPIKSQLDALAVDLGSIKSRLDGFEQHFAALVGLMQQDVVRFNEIRLSLNEIQETLKGVDERTKRIEAKLDGRPDPATGPGSYLPRARNPNFVGRASELSSVIDALKSSTPTALTQAVTGGGGVGKSQLAQRVFELLADVFAGRWWLDCSRLGHKAALGSVAGAMGLELPPENAFDTEAAWFANARAMLVRFMSDGRRHLLVLDNLESPSSDPAHAPFSPATTLNAFPLPAGCAVLVTTRWTDIRSAVPNAIDVNKLLPADARELFRKRFVEAGRSPAASFTDADLDALCVHVGHLAIAVDLLAAHLFVTPSLSPAKLLADLRSNQAATLKRFDLIHERGLSLNYDQAVAVSLSLHLSDPQIASALPVLDAASVLAPDAIPLDLLAGCASVEGGVIEDAVGLLASRSLLWFDDAASIPSVNLHRLLQDVVRKRLRESARLESTLDNALRAMIEVFRYQNVHADGQYDFTRTPRRLACLAHAESVLQQTDAAGIDALGARAASLNGELANWLPDIGSLAAAERASDAAIALDERRLPSSERDLAIWYATRAVIRRLRGDLAGAEADIRRSIDWGERQSPRDERTLAIWYATRAGIRQDRGDLAGAEEDIQHSIAWGERQSPKDERELAIWYATRARIRQYRGDLAGAEADIKHSIDWGERQSPKDERELTIHYATRASIRRDRGDLAGAEADIRHSIDWSERQSPKDERSLAIWYATRAGIRQARGDLAGAEEDIQYSIDWGERQSPKDERSLAIWYATRAGIRRVRGDLAGAEADIKYSIHWGERQSPKDERELAVKYATRAGIRRDRGDLAGAEADIRRSIDWGKRQSPKDERGLAIWYVDRARIDVAFGHRLAAEGKAAEAAARWAAARAGYDRAIAWFEANLPGDTRVIEMWKAERAAVP